MTDSTTSLTANAQPIRSSKRMRTFVHALLFVLGFSLTFIVGWGGAFTFIGQMFTHYKLLLGQIGGIVIIVFGLFNLGIVKIAPLNYDTRPQLDIASHTGFVPSILMGVFFAAGWTPCIGTTLGAILTLGFSQETVGQAIVLSSGYSLGLGIPFLIIGLGIDRATHLVGRFRRHIRTLQIASGLLLIMIGILLLTKQMTVIAIWAQSYGLYIDLPMGGGTTPSYLIAILGGLLSFLSPCVLPLVPAYVGYLSGQAVREL